MSKTCIRTISLFSNMNLCNLVLVIYSLFMKALDRVIEEARRHGIRLILSLVNNLDAYGGKSQYVKWAWEEGVGMSSSNDSFFYDPFIRSYFKLYLKVIHLLISLLYWSLLSFSRNGLIEPLEKHCQTTLHRFDVEKHCQLLGPM